MDLDALLNEVADAQGGYEYFPPGTHKVRFQSYQFKDGSGYKKAVGPAFSFTLLSSSNPACSVGGDYSRLIKFNVNSSSPDKRKAALGRRKDEVVSVMRALFISKGLIQPDSEFSFDDIKEDLKQVDKLNKLFEGAEIVCTGESSAGGDGKTYTNLTYSACE